MAPSNDTSGQMVQEKFQVEWKHDRGYWNSHGILEGGKCFWYQMLYKWVGGRPILQLYEYEIELMMNIKNPT